MKITIIIPSLAVGGAEIQTIAQANELSARGIKIQIIILSDIDNLKDNLNKDILVYKNNMNSLRTLNKISLVGVIFSLKRIANEINHFTPDHIIAMLPLAFLVTRLLKRFRLVKGKVWIYHHSTEYAETPVNNLFRKIYKRLFISLLSMKKYEKHIFISDSVKNDIIQNEFILSSFVIYNAVSIPQLNAKEQEQLQGKFELKNKRYIIFPGSLSIRKGHVFFINAVSGLIKENDLKLLIAGDGPLIKEIKNSISDQNIEDKVLFTGNLPNKKLLELMSGAYLCVIPSIIEGFGNVAIESLAVGTTVLCSNAGGLPEVITDGKTGYIFEKGNADDLRNKLEKLLNNPELLINPSVLKKEYHDKFTIRIQIDNFLKVLNAEDNP